MSRVFQGRFGAEHIHRVYASIADAFQRGDYQFVARNGAACPELQGAAYILIGNPERGISIFRSNGVTSPLARLTTAFSHWYLGDLTRARAELEGIADDGGYGTVAKRLSDLLEKPRIKVLLGSSRPSVMAAFRKVPDFDVKTVGFPGQDVDLPVGPGRRLSDTPQGRQALAEADLFFLYDQGVPVPCDLANANLPCFAFVPDAEMHLANQLAEMRLFDGILTTCSQVRLEMEALYGGTVFASPILASLSSLHQPEVQPELPDAMAGYLPDMQARPIDVLFTGSVNTPMYLEKPPAMFQLGRIEAKADIRIFDRAFPYDHYKRLMRSSKCTVVSVRMLDPLSTRALQALAEGTFVLEPAPSALDLYLEGEADGLFTIDPAQPEPVIRRIVADYPALQATFGLRKADLARRMARLFPASPEIEARWLRLSLFLSLLTPRRDKSDVPVNCAVNWWTQRHFVQPQAVLDLMVCDPSQADAALKLLVSRATMAAASKDHAALRRIAHEAQPMADHTPTALAWRLTQVFCLLLCGDAAAFDRLSDIWTKRDLFVSSPADGLVWFDFTLGVWLRHYFVSEALYNDAVIMGMVTDHHDGHCPGAPQAPPLAVLLGGVGACLAYRALHDGHWAKAMELASEAGRLHPRNPVAKHVQALSTLAMDRGDALAAAEDAVFQWPWYLPEVLARLQGKPDLDRHFLDGRAEVDYLRFFQRVHSDRRFVASLHLPRPARGYLRWKLGIGAGASVKGILDILTRRDLLVGPFDSVLPNVVLPLAWDSAEAAWIDGGPEEISSFDDLRSLFGAGVEPLRAEFDPWAPDARMGPPKPLGAPMPLPGL